MQIFIRDEWKVAQNVCYYFKTEANYSLDNMLKSYGEIHGLQFSIITYSEGQNSQQSYCAKKSAQFTFI